MTDDPVWRRLLLSVLLAGLLAAASPAMGRAQAPTPERLAEQVLDRLMDGGTDAYRAVYPFEPTLKAQAGAWGVPVATDPPVVVRREGDTALLLLGAWPVVGNRGDETVVGRTFSGLYVARRHTAGWRLAEALPPDAGNRILAHRLAVTLDPAYGLTVVDTLAVRIEERHGFGAHLNRGAAITGVTVDGRTAEHAFAGGYLWVDVEPADSAEIVLAYRLPVADDTLGGPNSGRFGPDYGHVRTQYFWHPFYDFGSGRDRARFDMTLRAPAGLRVVTGLPQADTVIGDERVVRVAGGPTFGATLVYDAAFEPVTDRLGELAVELYLTGDADPSADSILASLRRTYALLADRFGPPRARYLAIAQLRHRSGRGWPFRANDLIAAAARPGRIGRGGPYPRAWLGHEVAHGWTAPTGPATNFLSEGWANYAESILIAERYGPRAEADYWESQRTYYERNGFDGRDRLSHDPNNSGVSYNKGAWVLRMLEDRIGDDAFHRGFAAYMATPAGAPAGLDEFLDAMENAVRQSGAGPAEDAYGFPGGVGDGSGPRRPRDGDPRAYGVDGLRAFLRPWVEEAVIPDLRARVEPGRVVVEQTQEPLFDLELELALVVGERADTVRRTLTLKGRADTLDTGPIAPVHDVLVDPHRRLLLRRDRGDVVRLAIAAPGADSVKLGATFLGGPIPAARQDDGSWIVELTLTEGVYGYWWWVDGAYVRPQGGERLVVEPAEQVRGTALP